jgi:hypothetical protein
MVKIIAEGQAFELDENFMNTTEFFKDLSDL